MIAEKTGYAVQVWRRGRYPGGAFTEGFPINFWHHPPNAAVDRRPFGADVPYDWLPLVQPVNATRHPPLIFQTETEAEVATEFFNSLWGGPRQEWWRDDVFPGEYVGHVREVNGAPNVTLSDNGFQPLIPAGDLFS